MVRLRLAPLVVTVLLGSALQAQPASLVKDIALGSVTPHWPYQTEWVALGSLAVFTNYDPVHGLEIWRSDGTAAGTHPILDLCPGICSSDPGGLTVVGGTVFFGADDGVHGRSLWKTDGTAAGTTLVREVEPSLTVALGSLLVFSAATPEAGQEIWRSDGTRAGTFPLGDLRPGADGSYPSPLGYAGSSLLFSAFDPVHGRALWKTDGTAANTSFVAEVPVPVTGAYGPPIFPSLGGRLFYPGADSHLWVSDGTAAGTYKVSDVVVASTNSGLNNPVAVLGSEVFFLGGDQLWKTDGTANGTTLVKDLEPGVEGSTPFELTVAGDQLFFRDTSGYGTLWKSDGTPDGTVPVEPIGTALAFDLYFNAFQALGDKLVFFALDEVNGHEPWVSDGTGAGTVLLADIYPGISSSFAVGSFPPMRLDAGSIAGGEWLFRANTPGGLAVWKSDGTPGGTELVEAVNDGAGAWGLDPTFDPTAPSLSDLDGTLIFAAKDDSWPMDLWRSDGSEAGTMRMDGGDPDPMPPPPHDLTRLGGKIYFIAGSLWRTDGDTAETVAGLGYLVQHLTAAGPNLFFTIGDLAGDRLFRTDGSGITQIWSEGASVSQLTGAGSNLFFARPSGSGEELWKSNGEPNDAVELTIFPGTGSAQPRSIAASGSSVFLSANDGSTGRELWTSDGTLAGTRRVKDIRPGAASSDPRSIVAAGDLVFFVADDGVAGAELWRSDGTAAGTFRVKDIQTGPQPSWIRGITAHGDRVFFAADDGVNGVELWTSDGSEAGTFLVEDIRPGAGSSYPGAFRSIGHVVLFAVDDGTHGLEPWRTDGTAAGTFLLQDVLAGPEPSSPAGFTLSGGFLYFIATDRTHGFELWALDRAVLGSRLSAAKRVVGTAIAGGTLTWEIVITNTGAGPHPDNAGDEMVDVLPAPLVLTGASADVGTISVDLGQNRVAWNGALEPGESATVTIEAEIPASAIYRTFSNQATLSFDADGDGASESTGVSDDPGRGGPGQATPVVIGAPPADFYTITPCRVFDTRGGAPLAAGVPRTITVGGTCGIPATARAVAANLTVAGATASGNIVVYPAGIPAPGTSNVNFPAALVRANNAHVGLLDGEIEALARVQGGGTVHLIVDVTGYYE